MYTGYLLSEESRALLLAKFPPKYKDVIAHHITEKFGVKANTKAPEQPSEVWVVGYMDDGEGVEGLLVEVDGTVERPSGGKYHITWSIDRSKGKKPYHTNDITHLAKPVAPSIKIEVEPKVFA
jgi:hypothetical protein